MVATTTTTMPPKLNNILLMEIPNIAQKKKHKSQIQEELCKCKIVEDDCLRIKVIETTCKIRASKEKMGPIAFNPPSLNTCHSTTIVGATTVLPTIVIATSAILQHAMMSLFDH
jgi:hypothetical protein